MFPAFSRRALALGLLSLAACSGTPTLYTLPPPAPVTEKLATRFATVSVADISLPTYADANEIAILSETGALELDKSASWADTPRRGLTRHLIAALGQRLHARIAAAPWPGFDNPALRVEVTVDQMIAAPQAVLRMSGQYLLIEPKDGRIYASERFDLTTNVVGAGYDAVARAHARAIELLASDIVARMSGRARLAEPVASRRIAPKRRPI